MKRSALGHYLAVVPIRAKVLGPVHPLQPLRKIHQLDLVLYAHVRGRHLDDVEPLGDPGNPLVASDRGAAAVTSAVCETPSMSWMLRSKATRHGVRTPVTKAPHVSINLYSCLAALVFS
jgi:hypothetical protein